MADTEPGAACAGNVLPGYEPNILQSLTSESTVFWDCRLPHGETPTHAKNKLTTFLSWSLNHTRKFLSVNTLGYYTVSGNTKHYAFSVYNLVSRFDGKTVWFVSVIS
jgi:hypothetical protein